MQQESIIPGKSPNDERTYQAIELSNKIKVLFVYDDKAEKAACSISVGVGSLKDGQRSFGLAHFLEHMLFMGSRKFPRHNEYSQFISLNSGSDNAWTSDEETNYYFEIANSKFFEGVQRISDFFVQALLTDFCIQKQRQAVHEECQLRCGEDNSRKWQILKHFASGPYHNHSIGNNQTLTHPHVRQDLVQFYKREYSANRINVVLLSAIPIAEMKQKTLPFFLEIQNKHLPPIDYQIHFQQSNTSKMVRMKSIKDESILEFFWVIDSYRSQYKWHPQQYITHVLGHEGKNSLLSILKQKEYASKIISYSHGLPRQAIVGLQIQLTETGVEEYEKVYNLVSDYCCWLKADQQIYNEIKAASEASFRFRQKSPNYSYVTDLSSTMHRIPLPQVINHRAIYAQFDGSVIDHYLKQLNPFNLLLFYSNSEELENPIVEKYLGGNFIVKDLPKRINSQYPFKSLAKNPFLPLNTTLYEPQKSNSNIVRQDNIYYSRGTFQVCKGGVQIIINSHQSQIFLELYASYLELLFKQITYEAESLKLQVQYEDQDQIKIGIFGFSDTVSKLLTVMVPLLTKIHRGQNAESLFELVVEDLTQEYDNFYFGEVDEICQEHLDLVLKNNGMPVSQCLQVLQEVEYKDFCKQIDSFWKKASLEWVVVGNFDKDFINTIKQNQQIIKCGTESGKDQDQLCAKLTKKSTIYSTKLTAQQITTSGCIHYHQIGQYDQKLYYTLSLLVNYIKEPFFDKLRTEKQLAYYLRAYPNNTRGVLALCFILISSNTDPRAVSNYIADFCKNFLQNAEKDLTNQKFEMIKNSVRIKVLEPHNSLKDYFEFVCRQIERKTFLFNRKQKQVLQQYLNSITKEDVINLLKESLQKSIQIWVVSKGHEQQFQKTKQVFEQLQQIRSSIQYYPEWHGPIAK